MAKSVGSEANSSSRLCLTFVKVTTPAAPRTPLPTKFAAAEKHTGHPPCCIDAKEPCPRLYVSLPPLDRRASRDSSAVVGRRDTSQAATAPMSERSLLD